MWILLDYHAFAHDLQKKTFFDRRSRDLTSPAGKGFRSVQVDVA